MTGKERVAKTIKREKPDRMPVYGWANNEGFSKKVIAKYGSISAFDDKYEFDLYHLFAPCTPVKNAAELISGNFFDDDIPEVVFTDPNDTPYGEIKKTVDFYGSERGRCVYAQTPGCFECFNGIFGFEKHLAYLILHRKQLAEFYAKLCDWTIKYAENLIDIGVDMIHISDDWGAQKGTLFSREIFDELIYPYHKRIAEAVRKRGAFLSLHSDGNVADFLDGVCRIGYDVVHPYQESAKMDYGEYFAKYKKDFVIMGGLDVQSTIGFGDYKNLENEIRRVVN
ncbi:MAG: uroporphyrinogen decarboxylase family protein, partial [Oscillospiraceae bacterium]|nr:uroporphyrinogen decarboxylase family protein [Oscillospiraceae bacterium]